METQIKQDKTEWLIREATKLVNDFEQDKQNGWKFGNPLSNPLMYILAHYFAEETQQ